MKTRIAWIAGAVALLATGSALFLGNATGQQRGDSQQEQTDGIPSGIVWYGKLSDGLAVAKETRRPIFLLSAAPQCAGVPGVW